MSRYIVETLKGFYGCGDEIYFRLKSIPDCFEMEEAFWKVVARGSEETAQCPHCGLYKVFGSAEGYKSEPYCPRCGKCMNMPEDSMFSKGEDDE